MWLDLKRNCSNSLEFKDFVVSWAMHVVEANGKFGCAQIGYDNVKITKNIRLLASLDGLLFITAGNVLISKSKCNLAAIETKIIESRLLKPRSLKNILVLRVQCLTTKSLRTAELKDLIQLKITQPVVEATYLSKPKREKTQSSEPNLHGSYSFLTRVQ